VASNDVFRLDQLPGFVAAEAEEPPLAYFSGPLTWYADKDPAKLREILAVADSVERVLRDLGFEVHIPHRDGGHEDDRETYSLNRDYIARSSLVVAYYDFPSTGLGQELEVAALYARPVVLLVNERRSNISTMIRSAFFAHAFVVFDDGITLAERLPAVAESLARSPRRGSLGTRLGEVVRRGRNSRGMTQQALAEAAGCSPALVRYIETGEPIVTSPSLVQVEAIAAALGIDAATLLGDGAGPSFERRVIDFASRTGRSSAAAVRVLEAAARQDSAWTDSDEGIARLFEIAEMIDERDRGSGR